MYIITNAHDGPLPATASNTDFDAAVLLDLNYEGLDGVKVEWQPRQDTNSRKCSGGRYVFEIKSNGSNVTVWATKEQMQQIRLAIEQEMAGNPPN
jgi:hypothetical protein